MDVRADRQPFDSAYISVFIVLFSDRATTRAAPWWDPTPQSPIESSLSDRWLANRNGLVLADL
jgi:hypothetical protein